MRELYRGVDITDDQWDHVTNALVRDISECPSKGLILLSPGREGGEIKIAVELNTDGMRWTGDVFDSLVSLSEAIIADNHGSLSEIERAISALSVTIDVLSDWLSAKA